MVTDPKEDHLLATLRLQMSCQISFSNIYRSFERSKIWNDCLVKFKLLLFRRNENRAKILFIWGEE